MESDKTDKQLVNEFLDGDEKAFNMIAMRYQERIYWHARRMTGNHFDADEIVQQVLIVIYNKLKSFNFNSALYTWIYTITTTRTINFLKSQKVKNFFSLDSAKNVDSLNQNDIINELEAKEKIEKLQKVLMKLPAKQRETFSLRNFDELSYEEISKITGKSVGALKSNYFHAIKKIKELMNEG